MQVKHYILVRLFTKLYKVILTFVCIDEILMCGHLNESYWAVVSCSVVNYTEESGCNVWVCGSDHWVQPLKGKVPSRILLWCCALCCVEWFSFYSLDETLKSDHSIEAVLSCGAVYYAVQCGSNIWVCGQKSKCDCWNESYRAVLSCGVVNSLPLSLRNINFRVLFRKHLDDYSL